MLHIAIDLDDLEARGVGRSDALQVMQDRTDWYDPVLLDVLRANGIPSDRSIYEVGLRDLEPGMVLIHDVKDDSGLLLIGHGQVVTTSLVFRLRNWSTTKGIREPLVVQASA